MEIGVAPFAGNFGGAAAVTNADAKIVMIGLAIVSSSFIR